MKFWKESEKKVKDIGTLSEKKDEDKKTVNPLN